MKQGSDLQRHFDLRCHCLLHGNMLSDVLSDRGWAPSTHYRLFDLACDAIAASLNERRVLDGGKSSRSDSDYYGRDPGLVCLSGQETPPE